MALKNKDYGVSFARMNGMAMIILCHIFQYFGNELAFWFNTGVQIFLFISGFLYGQRLEQCDYQFVKRSFKKILLDYYVCIVLCIGLYVIFEPTSLSCKELLKLILCYGFGNISSVSHLWFIPIILFCYLITPMVGKVICEQLNQLCAKVLLKMAFSICVLYVVLKLFFSYFTAELVVCYCIGLAIGRTKLKYGEQWKKIVAIVIIPIAILMNGIRIYLNYYIYISFETETMQMAYESFEQGARVALGISLFLLFYYIYYQMLSKIKWLNQILDLSDRYSYDIYLAHQTWILGAFSLLKLDMPIIIRLGLVIIACVAEGVLIHMIAQFLIGNRRKWKRNEKR